MQEQTAELDTLLTEIRGGWGAVSALPTEVESLRTELRDVRRLLASRSPPAVCRPRGEISEDAARQLAATYVLFIARSGRLEALSSIAAQRDNLLALSAKALNLTTRAALTTSEVPLPEVYGGELRDLISEFGVVRRRMAHYPIAMGTARPARMGARPAFGSIAMSAAFSEKAPGFGFASLESHKIGGIVRLPRELDEQSIVSIGQFLARYGAVEFARAEDTWAFLADGSGTYESVKGIISTAKDGGATVTLASGKTKPSDATLEDFRALRRTVNKAALNGRISAYYLDSTWETRLAGFRTAAEPNVYQRLPDGSAILDGYPVVWTDVLQAYGTDAAANKALAVFGALSFWWMGEHGTPRIDTSDQVFFVNDQVAVRFIEEIDFDYAAGDATGVLLTAAS